MPVKEELGSTTTQPSNSATTSNDPSTSFHDQSQNLQASSLPDKSLDSIIGAPTVSQVDAAAASKSFCGILLEILISVHPLKLAELPGRLIGMLFLFWIIHVGFLIGMSLFAEYSLPWWYCFGASLFIMVPSAFFLLRECTL